MKFKFIFISIFSLFISCSDSFSQNQRLSVADFENKINSLKNEQLIDVRTPEEYNAGHIPNAININFNDPAFQSNIQKLDKQKPILLYCAAGGRSARALKIVNDLKFKEVYELSVGFNGWSQSGKPSNK